MKSVQQACCCRLQIEDGMLAKIRLLKQRLDAESGGASAGGDEAAIDTGKQARRPAAAACLLPSRPGPLFDVS